MGNRIRHLIDMKIEPALPSDRERLGSVLTQMATDNADFGYSKDKATGEMLVTGPDESRLENYLGSFASLHGIEILLGAPQVRYREALISAAGIDYTHKKIVTGANSEFARVVLKLEPNASEAGNAFTDQTVGEVIPARFVSAIEKGVASALAAGVLLGFPVVDTSVTLVDGAHHEIDSSAQVFEAAARIATHEGATKAGIKVLEPIIQVEVTTPGEFIGAVLSDINARRGRICRQEMRGSDTEIMAQVPLSCLFGYRPTLLSITEGRARHSMHFSHYDRVPRWSGPDDFPPAVGMRA